MGEQRQRSVTTGILLLTLTIVALFVAQGATQLVASSVLELAPQTSSGVYPSARYGAGPQPKSGTAILKRNIFDSASGPMDGPPPPDPSTVAAQPAVPLDPNAPPPPCDGSVRLVGSLYREGQSQNSLAVISTGTGVAQVFAIGMSVADKQVVDVHPDSVDLRPSGGNACRLTMFARSGTAAPPPPAPIADAISEPSPADVPGGIPNAELEKGIQKVSDREYNVSRTLLNKLLENQAELMRSATIKPISEGGRVTGVRLFGIRRNSLLGRVGLNNGDTLRTINGYDMADPKGALEAYAKLRNANRLSVSVVRGGSPVTLEYSIR